MTSLTDAQIERYSRQIIMPEVGGRGQERLLATRIAVAGAGTPAAVAASLLARAGIGALDLIGTAGPPPDTSPGCRVRRGAAGEAVAHAPVLVDFMADPALARAAAAAGRACVRAIVRGARGTVLTLLGRPCAVCVEEPAALPAVEDDPLGAPAALAVGALAASEALRVVLTAPGEGRLHTLDLAAGHVGSHPLRATAGCPVCARRA